MTALYFRRAAAAGPRRGQAARLADLPRDPVSARQADPREAGELPRLQGRAELSLAHQGHRRRRLLDRLGRPRRRADVVLVAGAGLRARARLGEGPPGRPHDRAGRRRRARRRQHLRGAARRLEAGPAQLLVDHRLQPPEPRRGRARRPVGALRAAVQEFRLGRRDPEIRLAAAGRVPRAGRRDAAAPGSTTARTSSTRRWCSRAARRGASACIDEIGDQGDGHEADRDALRRRTGAR